ncbi:MAG: hypothetical protein IJS74_03115 [Clostridia bacterium]|nr:hypothetical protein [Clostridia bacterium]
MKVIKIILIVMLFGCFLAGLVFVFGASFLAQIRHKNQDNSRRVLKFKLIGYILFMASFAFAIFQSLIAW